MRKMAHTSSLLKISICFTIFMQGVLSSCAYKSNLKRHIRGMWAIDVDNSYVERSVEIDLVGSLLCVGEQKIVLPRNYHSIIGEDSMSIEEKEKKRIELNVLSEKESDGEWDVIYSTSDSVIFKAPNHPLNGRYEVHIIQEDLHEYMTLSNDSTYLVCYRSGYVR